MEIINYEKLKTAKTPWFTWRKGKHWGNFNIPPGTLVIFDEAHRCRGRTTKNTKILIAATEAVRNPANRSRLIMLSATIAQDCYQMRSIGYALGLFETYTNHFMPWCFTYGLVKSRFGFMASKVPENMKKIHSLIFPDKGVRIRHSEVEGFPENQISTWSLPVSNPSAIDKAWQQIQDLRKSDEDRVEGELRKWLLSDKPDDEEFDANKYGQGIVEALRDWQEAELQIVPAMADLAIDYVIQGMNVPVFLNFKRSIETFKDRIDKAKIPHATINGDTKQKDRISNIDAFQRNRIHCLISQSQTVKEGIDLHDLYGRQRVSLISVGWDSTQLKQILGRIHRAGAVSPALQRLCFSDKSKVHRRIKKQVDKKLENITILNDGDLR